jgi:hypothetical protein
MLNFEILEAFMLIAEEQTDFEPRLAFKKILPERVY